MPNTVLRQTVWAYVRVQQKCGSGWAHSLDWRTWLPLRRPQKIHSTCVNHPEFGRSSSNGMGKDRVLQN